MGILITQVEQVFGIINLAKLPKTKNYQHNIRRLNLVPTYYSTYIYINYNNI